MRAVNTRARCMLLSHACCFLMTTACILLDVLSEDLDGKSLIRWEEPYFLMHVTQLLSRDNSLEGLNLCLLLFPSSWAAGACPLYPLVSLANLIYLFIYQVVEYHILYYL